MAHDHHHEELVAQLRELVGGIKVARDDGKVTLKEALGIAADVLCAAAHAVDAMTDPINGAGELSDAAEALFDSYVNPLDIVGVPNALEPYIKAWARGLIRPAITGLVSNLGTS